MINFSSPNDGTLRTDTIFRENIVGSRRFSNFFWALTISLGGSGFLIVGISSYLKHNLLFFLNANEIVFFPQGLVMSLYGIGGLILSIYQWLVIFWQIGEGYNEFDKNSQMMKIFRWGFPGLNRKIEISYPIKEIEAIRVEIKEGINPKRIIYVCVRTVDIIS